MSTILSIRHSKTTTDSKIRKIRNSRDNTSTYKKYIRTSIDTFHIFNLISRKIFNVKVIC